MSEFPRLVIAAPQGRSGKTTLTLGLCAAIKAQGFAIQPFKKGPDYIDPSWLSEAAGQACYTLDPFFYNQPDALIQAFVCTAQQADISLVEGNHGIFDSFDDSGSGSTAALARTLQAPILLVINATRIGRSIAAIVHGCQTFEPQTPIAGVVLNQVAHSRHESRLRQAIESYCSIPVVGSIPRNESLSIPDRHLGLVPRGENEALLPVIAACKQMAERNLDLQLVYKIACSAPQLQLAETPCLPPVESAAALARIGVFRDRAFTFYYPDNLDALQSAGAQLVFIDSLNDALLPDLDLLYIGGGFPEMFMEQIAANAALRSAVRQAVEAGLPVYAECGGLMYLSQRIRWGDQTAEMAGVLPCEIEMTHKPQGHGYVVASVDHENPFFPPGSILRGHEFHNSRLYDLSNEQASGSLNTCYHLTRGNGLGDARDGIVYRNVLASYTHLHAGGAPGWASGLVRRARVYRQSRGGIQPCSNHL